MRPTSHSAMARTNAITRPPPRCCTHWALTVADQLPTGVHLSASNSRYLAAKARRGAHTLNLPDLGYDGDGAIPPIGARHPEVADKPSCSGRLNYVPGRPV